MATQIQRRSASRPGVRRGEGVTARRAKESWRSITVDARPEECYRLWRDAEILPCFLSLAPQGVDIVEDEPGHGLTWRPRSEESESMEVSVRFDHATGNRGTVVRLQVRRGKKAERLRADRELHRFKQWKETGEISTIEGQPAGRRGPMGRLLRKGEQ